jgi:hypothetical protein
MSYEQVLISELLRGKDVAHLSRVLKVAKKTIYRWINGECKPCLGTYKTLVELHAKNKVK